MGIQGPTPVSDNLASKAHKAVVWSAIENFSSQGVRFGIGVVLARLLEPAEFGLIGMLAVFMTLSRVLVDSGLTHALIQKRDLTPADESTAFYLNIGCGFVATIALYAGAPMIADFYGQPKLIQLTRLLAVAVLINSFAVVQTSLLTRRMDFKMQTKVTVLSSFASGILAIYMAYWGYGVTALAAQTLAEAAFGTLLLWKLSSWRPRASFSSDSFRSLFSFGSRLLASGVLNAVFVNINSVVIGKLFNPSDLGFYTRASNIQALPSENLGKVVSRVSFPVFSSVQGDKPRLKRALRKATVSCSFVNFPVTLGLACVASPLVEVLLTKKWLPCVPYIQLLCAAGLLYPLQVLHLNALMAQGRSDLFLRLDIIKKLLVALAVLACFRFGVPGLIMGQVVVSIVAFFINSFYTVRFLNYEWKEQFSDLWPYCSVALLMGASVVLVAKVPLPHAGLRLGLQVGTGILMYISGSFIFRLPMYLETKELLCKYSDFMGRVCRILP